MCRAGWEAGSWGFGSREDSSGSRVGVRCVNLLKLLDINCLPNVFPASSFRLPGLEAGGVLRNWGESAADKLCREFEKRLCKGADIGEKVGKERHSGDTASGLDRALGKVVH